MHAYVVVSLIGSLAFDNKGKRIGQILFEKSPKIIAKRLDSVDSGKPAEETLQLIQKLRKEGYSTFTLPNQAIAEAAQRMLGVKADFGQHPQQDIISRENLERLALESQYVETSRELRNLIREISTELTRLRVKKAGEKRDLMVAQAILSIDDLDRTANLFMGRIREWYSLHFPELNRMVENHETYARLLLALGERSNFTVESLREQGMTPSNAKEIAVTAEESMGAELERSDIKQIASLCKQVLYLYDSRQKLQEYASLKVEEVAPNTQALVGSLLAARLIALAGGLVNLAKMPASTIQVLGAEKALFRALKTGTRPPKHGIIFQDSLIHEAKRWQRGKMSRALAGKLAIAARTDAFSGRYIGDSLKANLQKRVEEIKAKYQKPPSFKKKQKSLKPTRRRRRAKRVRRR
ncbi:MAG: C/D box methylation guide ribonucleoprotein complex aNOP56 subunit [Candidatus Bathyarchaeota archaeon]|nr:MAG: C/D box methylation guide ribonucleoprotein complex aNOP56 subunit [Candidatus Bathyarchaeota archaeon]